MITSHCKLELLRKSHYLLTDPRKWSARSPNLSACDYYLWGYVKAEVYKYRPTTIDGLKAAIRQTVNKIPQEMTRRVRENFRNCLQQCIEARGRQYEEVIFKTYSRSHKMAIT